MDKQKIVIKVTLSLILIQFTNLFCYCQENDLRTFKWGKRVYVDDSVYYKLINVDENYYKIIWGNRHFENRSKAKIGRSGNYRMINFAFIDSNFVYMYQPESMMEPRFDYLLPIQKGGVEKYYKVVVFIDYDKKIVLYDDETMGTKDYVLKIENYVSGKRARVKLKDISNQYDVWRNIQNVKILNDTLEIDYLFRSKSKKKKLNNLRKVKISISDLLLSKVSY